MAAVAVTMADNVQSSMNTAAIQAVGYDLLHVCVCVCVCVSFGYLWLLAAQLATSSKQSLKDSMLIRVTIPLGGRKTHEM